MLCANDTHRKENSVDVSGGVDCSKVNLSDVFFVIIRDSFYVTSEALELRKTQVEGKTIGNNHIG